MDLKTLEPYAMLFALLGQLTIVIINIKNIMKFIFWNLVPCKEYSLPEPNTGYGFWGDPIVTYETWFNENLGHRYISWDIKYPWRISEYEYVARIRVRRKFCDCMTWFMLSNG